MTRRYSVASSLCGVMFALALSLSQAGCNGRNGADANNLAAAQSVVVYCSVDPEFAQGILAEFEKKTGIKPLVRFDEEAVKTTGLVQRLRAEADAPTADVFWSSECFQTIKLAREGLFTPYHGEATKDWPAQFADHDGRWYAFGLRMRVIAWDARRVKPNEAPKKLEDLLDPRFRGRVVMAEPSFGTTRGDVQSWFVHYGPDRAREILQGLAANKVGLVKGNSTAVRTVVMGEADVCFTDTDDAYVAQAKGWPIAMTPLDQGGDGTLAIPNTVAMVKGAPHAAAAKTLIEFLLSEQVERMLAKSESHNVPIRPAVAAEFSKYAIGKPLAIDYGKVAAQDEVAMKAIKEILH